jgi:Arc/MetJ-type ribon-helix-helix transcriptional regulator
VIKMKKESVLTLKFKGVEARLLEDMVKSGLFNSKSEAIRSALVYYSIDLGLLRDQKIWDEIDSFPRRKVAPKELAKDLAELEDEA